MKYNLISCSFVGVWEKPFLNMPMLDRKFCMDLFNDPYNTTCSLTPDGFVIAKQFAPPPVQTVIINPNRIQISDLNISRISELCDLIFDSLRQTNSQDMFHPFSSIGINTEHEWIDLEDSAENWLEKKFFQGFLYHHSESSKIVPSDIRFEWRFKDNQKFNILLQPRAGNSKALFAGVNDDKFWSEKQLPNREQFFDMFTESTAYVKKRMEEILTENEY